ncbi:hypothetical protein CFP56_043359 [Quercus suber]|uniref:Uncharacterized protein n=1 Tax=Quercus suber TaxID=58331 RepID=A0AAW0LGU0_QUESU
MEGYSRNNSQDLIDIEKDKELHFNPIVRSLQLVSDYLTQHREQPSILVFYTFHGSGIRRSSIPFLEGSILTKTLIIQNLIGRGNSAALKSQRFSIAFQSLSFVIEKDMMNVELKDKTL